MSIAGSDFFGPSGGGGSGVSQIVAGTNVTVSPAGGTGVVTVNSTATAGTNLGWSVAAAIKTGGGVTVATVNGAYHPLSELYGTLAAAQADFPFVTNLAQTRDWCAIEAADLVAGTMGTLYIGHGVWAVADTVVFGQGQILGEVVLGAGAGADGTVIRAVSPWTGYATTGYGGMVVRADSQQCHIGDIQVDANKTATDAFVIANTAEGLVQKVAAQNAIRHNIVADNNTTIPVGFNDGTVMTVIAGFNGGTLDVQTVSVGAATSGTFTLTTHLAVPTIVQIRNITTGGTLTGGVTYGYKVTALNGAGETLPSPEVQLAVPAGTNTNQVALRCDPVIGATGYNWYGRTAGGPWLKMATTGNAFNDNGSITPAGSPPVVDTTGYTTGPIAYNALASTVQAALVALTSVGNAPNTRPNVTVAGAAPTWTCTFQGQCVGLQGLMTMDTSLLVGFTGTAVTHTTPGVFGCGLYSDTGQGGDNGPMIVIGPRMISNNGQGIQWSPAGLHTIGGDIEGNNGFGIQLSFVSDATTCTDCNIDRPWLEGNYAGGGRHGGAAVRNLVNEMTDVQPFTSAGPNSNGGTNAFRMTNSGWTVHDTGASESATPQELSFYANGPANWSVLQSTENNGATPSQLLLNGTTIFMFGYPAGFNTGGATTATLIGGVTAVSLQAGSNDIAGTVLFTTPAAAAYPLDCVTIAFGTARPNANYHVLLTVEPTAAATTANAAIQPYVRSKTTSGFVIGLAAGTAAATAMVVSYFGMG